jgi:hypothetical protein
MIGPARRSVSNKFSLDFKEMIALVSSFSAVGATLSMNGS